MKQKQKIIESIEKANYLPTGKFIIENVCRSKRHTIIIIIFKCVTRSNETSSFAVGVTHKTGK